jgi:hypothetical protein
MFGDVSLQAPNIHVRSGCQDPDRLRMFTFFEIPEDMLPDFMTGCTSNKGVGNTLDQLIRFDLPGRIIIHLDVK